MSVYTSINGGELAEFLAAYSVGTLVDFEGISEGIENTNYFVTTTKTRYVLTLFEQLKFDELPYFLNIMAFLSEHEVPSAHPIADKQQHFLRRLKGKPAALVQCLAGKSIEQPTLDHCRSLGAALGRFHRHSQMFQGHRDNMRGPAWWQESIRNLRSVVDPESAKWMGDEIEFQAHYQQIDLPQGVIHADLFRDNALFEGNQLSGIIDFYYACNDALLYDIAVVANDWCSQPDGSFYRDKLDALLSAYDIERPLQQCEKKVWGVMLRASALRFWLSRLQDLHFPRPGEMTHTKDPDVFARIFKHRVTHFDALQATW